MIVRVVICGISAFSKQISTMRPLTFFPTLAALVLLAACSTPASRIANRQETFDAYPVAVQQKIRAGQVAVGYTQEMVLLALGEPARKYTRKTENEDTEIWGYHDTGPRFSFGIGLGTGSRHSSMRTGIGMSTGGDDPEEKMRIEFRDGQVVTVDSLKR
jgi:hypothetical protein